MALQIDFTCPSTRPEQSPTEMAELQEKLDQLAQNLFGPRKKRLLAPEFVAGGPNVRFTVDETGAYAELSLAAAAGYWPTAIYQLAHEIIHLLDPRIGYPKGRGASWFEEGLAVHFSLSVLQEIFDPTVLSLFSDHLEKNGEKYYTALQLFSELDEDVYTRARQIRQSAGHFSDATAEDFKRVSPNLKDHIAIELAKSFYEKKEK